ncbi:MAG: hypothetical protein AAB920_03375 [Patescibacteria group bacterium]
MAKPLLPWNRLKTATHPQLVWWIKMDHRFLVEVHRTLSDSDRLHVFDHERNDNEILCWDIGCSYGAEQKPSDSNINAWKEGIADFIDNTYPGRE